MSRNLLPNRRGSNPAVTATTATGTASDIRLFISGNTTAATHCQRGATTACQLLTLYVSNGGSNTKRDQIRQAEEA